MQAECDNCGAKATYAEADIQSETSRDQTGDVTTDRWVVCPKCGERVYLEPSDQ